MCTSQYHCRYTLNQVSRRQRLTDVTTIGLPVPWETRPSTEPPVPFSSTIPSITGWDRRYVLRNQTTKQCTHVHDGGTVIFHPGRPVTTTGRGKSRYVYYSSIIVCRVRGVATGRELVAVTARDDGRTTRIRRHRCSAGNVDGPSCRRARMGDRCTACVVLRTRSVSSSRRKLTSSG